MTRMYMFGADRAKKMPYEKGGGCFVCGKIRVIPCLLKVAAFFVKINAQGGTKGIFSVRKKIFKEDKL